MKGSITVENLSKDFKLPHEKANTLKGTALNLLRLRRNRTIETQKVLSNISLSIEPGEFFGILGRNGSGKSTLLKILAGIYQPTSGEVRVEGKLIPFIELGVGFNGELSGRDNVYLNGSLLGFSKSDMNKMYRDIVEFAELENFMDQKLKNYSSGMQVRLAFSIAVRAQADVLLIDEVLAVGDAAFQRKCFEYFKELKAKNKTVVLVTHDMDAVREYCDRAILLEKNKVKEQGAANDVAEAYLDLFITEQGLQGKNKFLRKNNAKNKDIVLRAVELDGYKYTENDAKLKLKVTLESNRLNKNPMTGFRVRNEAGLILQEANTWNERFKLPVLKENTVRNIVWEMPNIYSEGAYSIDTYVYGDNNRLLDKKDHAVKFKVSKPHSRGHIVKPIYNIKIE